MTDIAHQYRTIADRAGWTVRDGRGVVRVEGPDRLSFLHALLTNDVLALAEERGVAAAYLTPQGRMIASMDVLNRGDHVLLLVDRDAGSLASRLDGLIFAEQVTVTDASQDWIEIDVIGGRADAVVSELFGADVAELRELPELAQHALAVGFVCRGGDASLPVFRVFLPPDQRPRVVATLESHKVPAIAEALVTSLRIEAGRGAWGVDLFEDTIPLEAGLLERAISTAKGCYVGQEVVIRILHRGGGRVAKRLVQIALDAGSRVVPEPGTVLAHGAEITGRVTSAAFSPARGAVLALGYVHRDVAEIGKSVAVGTDGVSGTITALAS
jgi:folate-binding protein YgfZ